MIMLGDPQRMGSEMHAADALLAKKNCSPLELLERVKVMSARKRGPRKGTQTRHVRDRTCGGLVRKPWNRKSRGRISRLPVRAENCPRHFIFLPLLEPPERAFPGGGSIFLNIPHLTMLLANEHTLDL